MRTVACVTCMAGMACMRRMAGVLSSSCHCVSGQCQSQIGRASNGGCVRDMLDSRRNLRICSFCGLSRDEQSADSQRERLEKIPAGHLFPRTWSEEILD